MSDEYPLKHIRLQQLHDAGFNIVDFICFPPKTLAGREQELKDFLEAHKRISCRHFHDNEKKYFKCPFLPDQTDWETILGFCLENNKQFYTLCNEAIDPKESICAGNILVFNEETCFVEYFYGPGTPRDIESKGPDELKRYSKAGGEEAEGEKPPKEVLNLVLQARQFKALENKPYIVEFSVYPYPIGRKQTKVIVWEWRWGWLHYQMQLNQFLLHLLQTKEKENQEHKAEIQRLRTKYEELDREFVVHKILKNKSY